jgi:hypothetical protein
MTKEMVFLELSLLFFFFFMDDLELNDVALILSTNIDTDVSVETHEIWQTDKKKWQMSLFKIYAKPNDHILIIKNPMTRFK